MSSRDDFPTRFSHRLTQIKFIILEVVIFVGFLLWLFDKIKHDFHINFVAAPVSAASSAPPRGCSSASEPATQATQTGQSSTLRETSPVDGHAP